MDDGNMSFEDNIKKFFIAGKQYLNLDSNTIHTYVKYYHRSGCDAGDCGTNATLGTCDGIDLIFIDINECPYRENGFDRFIPIENTDERW